MSEATKQRLTREVDEFGDSYFDDVSSTAELAQVTWKEWEGEGRERRGGQMEI